MKIIKKHSYTIAIILITSFWLFYYYLGYPLPHIDDLFFIGAAINVAKNGEFFNPYIIEWAEPVVDRFYVQPPFHSITLAGWLKIFGISTQSLLLFQCFCYFIFSIFTALILKNYGFHPITAICTTICFATWMSIAGLRQDALSMAYLAIGLWLLTKDIKCRYFFGFSFLGFSILSSIVSMVYALPFSIAIVTYNSWRKKNTIKSKYSKYIIQRIYILLTSMVFVFILFLTSINFEFYRFISDIAWHASWRRNSIELSHLINVLTYGYREITDAPLYIFYIFLVCTIVVKRNYWQPKAVLITLTITIALILNLVLYDRTLFENFTFFCWLGVILIISAIPASHRTRITFTIVAIIIFTLNQSWNIINIIGKQTPKTEDSYGQIRQFVQENPHRKYLIDEWGARLIFDYNLPPNTIDWNFSRYYTGIANPQSITEKYSDEVWIISKAKGYSLEGLPDYPRVELFGYTFDSIPSQPDDVIIID
ncbi:hypothetical protein PJF56_11380 [Roseofilum sp. BLCC_M91]|uniref:Glycosyltransferase RgtA/B/C/D-like domain-containing protein n=1 Tax=Roseofilum halophilum BLCC-M91 TaxID=3022259 RepID=A0ABT7BK79_9CYAN|nr:hypothetical protein [Roseofilum halophilum]MDJ1179465.1 hypothetical protein [Roseofilum halophilum BLCC-M91]